LRRVTPLAVLYAPDTLRGRVRLILQIVSPYASKTLGQPCHMRHDVLHLFGPTAIVHTEGFGPAGRWDLVETGLGEDEQRAVLGLLQPEFHERGCFLRVVHRWIDGIGMPGERKQSFRLHVLHHDLPLEVLVAGIGNVSPRDLSRDEGAVERHAKPLAELAMIRQRAPDPGNWRSELETLLDAIAWAGLWQAERFQLVERHRPALPGALRGVPDLGRHDMEGLVDTDPRLLALLVERHDR